MDFPPAEKLTILGSDVAYWTLHPEKSRTIVMVHGFRGTHHGLQLIINELPDFRVIIPDLPGFGESTPMTERQHDIAGYSDFVAAFIEQLGLTRPVLLGHSFGTIVAAEVAARNPEKFERLILVNAISSPALKGPRRLFSSFAAGYYWLGNRLPEKWGHKLLASPAITLATSVLLAKTKDKNLRRFIHASHLRHFSTFQNREALQQAFRASISTTATDHAEKITTPTLLIAGGLDDIAPVKGQFALEERLPDGQLVIIKHTGHLIHHEAPRQAAAAITRFLR